MFCCDVEILFSAFKLWDFQRKNIIVPSFLMRFNTFYFKRKSRLHHANADFFQFILNDFIYKLGIGKS